MGSTMLLPPLMVLLLAALAMQLQLLLLHPLRRGLPCNLIAILPAPATSKAH